MTKKIVEYDVLRVIVTILVIIGHCGYFVINSAYGGCDYSEYAENISFIYKSFRNVVSVIYSFHMPLFMSLSGALFYNSYINGKVKNLISLAKSKFRRLIIPFLTVSVVFAFPIKYLSGYYENGSSWFKNLFIGDILLQGNSYLWYLMTLFLIFTLAYLLLKLNLPVYVNAGVLLLLSVTYVYVEVHILQYVMEYTFWFFIGYVFEEFRNKINKRINLIFGIVAFMLFSISYIVERMLHLEDYKLVSGFIEKIPALFGCLFVYSIAYLISQRINTDRKVYKLLSENTFGLYLYSDPFNYLLLYFSTEYFSDLIFSSNVYSSAFIIIRIAVNISFAMIISIILKKAKVKYLV